MIRCDSFHRTCASLQGEVALLDVTRSELPGVVSADRVLPGASRGGGAARGLQRAVRNIWDSEAYHE